MSRALGGLREAINPNHFDLDLHCSTGWSHRQTHILQIELHHHSLNVQLLQFLLGYHKMNPDLLII